MNMNLFPLVVRRASLWTVAERNYIASAALGKNSRWNHCHQHSTRAASNDGRPDEPVKYTTSDAAKWKAKYSTSGEAYFKIPPSQPLVIVASLSAFLIYFCILREENDLDDWLREMETNTPIQVQEYVLRREIASDLKKGKDVRDKAIKLKEITEQREKLRKFGTLEGST